MSYDWFAAAGGPAAPKPAAQASARPTVPALARAHKAARPDRLFGGFGSYSWSHMAEDQRRDLRGLINAARLAAQNNDHIKAFEALIRRHVIGRSGIRLEMAARDLNGDLDARANQQIEAAWSRWSQAGTCTVCGRFSWWNVENIMTTALAREGNGFLRIRRGNGRGPFGFQLQILSVDLLDLDLFQDQPGGNYVEGGIELTEEGRPAAYHFWTHHPLDRRGGNRRRVRIPADDIIHVTRTTDPLQTHGVPSSHTAVRRLGMIGEYETAALAAAHYGAANAMLLESEYHTEGAPISPDGGGADGVIPDQVEAGMVASLPPGVKVANWRPNYPDGEMPDFVAHMLRGAAAGLGISYSTLTGDLTGANFSSLRAGQGEERDEWRMLQRFMWEALHHRVFLAWLPAAIMSGEIRLPMTKLEKFQAATWQPRGWAAVNPKDDATANQADIALGLKAPSQIVSERGGDWDATLALIARDREQLAAARPAAAPPPPDDGGEDGDEDNAD